MKPRCSSGLGRAILGGAACVVVSWAFAQAPAESGAVDHATAVAFVTQVVELIESRALRPKDEVAYRDARRRLLSSIDTDGPIDRATLYGRTREMLWTLDTDGHTILWSKEQTRAFASSSPPARATAVDVVAGIDTADGPVVVFRPPAAASLVEADERAYAASLLANLVEAAPTRRACALVIDLTAQTGGIAWTPLAVLGTLLTDANRARLVDRDGVRTPLAPIATVIGNRRRLLPADAPDPLARFRGIAIGVVVGPQTGSAGETLDLMLMGEFNVRTFGRRTYGATTANVPVQLPDDALLLLTTYRYALGDSAPIRGAIEPDETVVDPTSATARAASWASARSPLCSRPGARTAVR